MHRRILALVLAALTASALLVAGAGSALALGTPRLPRIARGLHCHELVIVIDGQTYRFGRIIICHRNIDPGPGDGHGPVTR